MHAFLDIIAWAVAITGVGLAAIGCAVFALACLVAWITHGGPEAKDRGER